MNYYRIPGQWGEFADVSSPMPVELKPVDPAILPTLHQLAQPTGVFNSKILGGQITPDGKVGLSEDLSGTSPVYWDLPEAEDISAALRPVLDATAEWLPRDQTLAIAYATADYLPDIAYQGGGWHLDAPLRDEKFRGILLYDCAPTQFAVGETVAEHYSGYDNPNDIIISEHFKEGRLRLVDDIDPNIPIGVGNSHVHQVRPMQFTCPTNRSILTIRTLPIT